LSENSVLLKKNQCVFPVKVKIETGQQHAVVCGAPEGSSDMKIVYWSNRSIALWHLALLLAPWGSKVPRSNEDSLFTDYHINFMNVPYIINQLAQ
jgi:hypothetical protein